jgi:hypothetical protein
VLDSDASSLDLSQLATYLSELSVSEIEVVIVDGTVEPDLDRHQNVLRWVGRHVAARPQHRSFTGVIDPIRAAIDLASCDKVIVADARVRYSEEALEDVCALLDFHQVIQPQDYLDPLPWWGGIDAGRMLVHRGIGPLHDQRSTFAYRRSAVRALRSIDSGTAAEDCVRRLEMQGAEIFPAVNVFVRRVPPMLKDWLRERPRQADVDFSVPLKAALFFALLPVAIMLAFFGGGGLAGGYAGAVTVGCFALAFRGRIGAAAFFPWRTCFYAPLWLVERSVSIYWAWFRRLIGSDDTPRTPITIRSGARVASGE